MDTPTTDEIPEGVTFFDQNGALASFDPLAAELREVVDNARPILAATDATVAQVRDARLECKRARLAVEKQHMALKRPILDIGRALDARKRELLAIVEPTENDLGEKEEAIKRAEKEAEEEKRRQELARLEAIQDRFRAESLDVPPLWALESWDEARIEQEMATARRLRDGRLESQRLERIQRERERAAAEEAERQRKEVERLERERELARLAALQQELVEQRKTAEREREELARRLREAEERQEQEHVEKIRLKRELEALRAPAPVAEEPSAPATPDDDDRLDGPGFPSFRSFEEPLPVVEEPPPLAPETDKEEELSTPVFRGRERFPLKQALFLCDLDHLVTCAPRADWRDILGKAIKTMEAMP